MKSLHPATSKSRKQPQPQIALAAGVALFAFLYISQPGCAQSKKSAAKPAAAAKKGAKPAPAKAPAKPESQKAPEMAYTKPVLDPGQFFGEAMIGYSAAKAAPDVMAKLFCYCGCDETDHHSRLIDCFTSIHGVDCHICQEEAKLALRMHRDGSSMTEIQKTIDQTYASQYPFEKPTKTLEAYKENRLWKQTSDREEAAGTSPKESKEGTAKDKKPAPKLKPGAKKGTCCAPKECCAGDSKKKKP